ADVCAGGDGVGSVAPCEGVRRVVSWRDTDIAARRVIYERIDAVYAEGSTRWAGLIVSDRGEAEAGHIDEARREHAGIACGQAAAVVQQDVIDWLAGKDCGLRVSAFPASDARMDNRCLPALS